MRPLLLKGHERPLTHLHYNREGDLFFSTAKDHKPTMWRSDTGQRIGTYNGHNGSVWHCDSNWDSTLLLTGSGDMTAKLWELETGIELFSFPHQSGVRCVGFAEGGEHFLTVSDKSMGQDATIFVYKLSNDLSDQADQPIKAFKGHTAKSNRAFWGPLNATIISASDDATVRVWDVETGKEVGRCDDHVKGINNLSFTRDKSMFLTASKDFTARLFDTKTLKCLKVFKTDRPVNGAVISPIRPHIILGGGQEAMSVTLTGAKSGKFEAHFFHIVHEELLGSVKGHFGPINTLAFHPDGKSFVSGAEDGYIRLHHFDQSYFATNFNY